MATFFICIKFEGKCKGMAKQNDWKERLNVVYSTNPDFCYEREEETEEATLPPERQRLRISLDKRHRNGKAVTLITGFVGTESDLKDLAKRLKVKCGVGGSAKEGEILIQGDFRTRVSEVLSSEKYNVRIV